MNEHGTQDIPAMLEKIHEIKMEDLKDIAIAATDEGRDCGNSGARAVPYALCGVAHSLGGASMLMYVVTRRLEHKPHRLARLILLSPAGFHAEAPMFIKLMAPVVPLIAPLLRPVVPGLYIPTRVCRALFNKLIRDFQSYPAIGGLLQALLSLAIGGDSSNWIGALGMSHYNMDDMPGVSFRVAQHLLQMVGTKRFRMFDFGSARANLAVYGVPEPLDVGAHYGVIDIPVDVVAGVKDYVIPRSMVRQHFDSLKNAGCAASYDEFEYAHLDFTFSHREELLAYVMSRLLLVTPPPVRDLMVLPMDHPVPSFTSKRFKQKLNSLLSNRKSSSRKRESGVKPFERSSSKVLIDKYSAEPESSAALDTQSLSNDSEMMVSSVTAGSVTTDSHEESFRNCRTPSTFFRSSLSDQWTSSPVQAAPAGGHGMARVAKLEHRHKSTNSSIITKQHIKDQDDDMSTSNESASSESLAKSNAASTKLAMAIESRSRRTNPGGSAQRQLHNRQSYRSIIGLILSTLWNCYARPTKMLVEDFDE